jgi:hypothetical protein
MISSKNLFYCLLLLFIGLQSCSDDPDTIDPTDPNNNDNPIGTEVATLSSEVLTQWTKLYLELERYATDMRPNTSARAAAYVNLAAYEVAVPGMSTYSSAERSLSDFTITDLSEEVDWNIALNTAYADVIEHFLFTLSDSDVSRITAFEAALNTSLSQGVDEDLIDVSIQWGATAAQDIIAYSQTDTEAETQILEPQPLSYIPPTGEGFWTFNAEPERALFPY